MNDKSQFQALRDVASLINSGGDLDSVLRDLISTACHHAKWTMGSIMGIDAAHGFAHVIVRHDPTLLQRQLEDRWELATSPSQIALQRNQPVCIRDARASKEFPGYRKEAFERDYRTVVVLPMRCSDFDGRPMVMNMISREIVDVSEDDLAFLGMIVHLGAIAVEKSRRLQADRLFTERLERALQAHTSLLEQALSDSSIPSITSKISKLLPNPVVLVDFFANAVIAARSPNADLYDDQAWEIAARTTLSRDLMNAARAAIDQPHSGLRDLFLDDGTHRFRTAARIEPLRVDKEAVGALIVFPTSSAFGDLDLMLLDSARFALCVQMMRNVIRFRTDSRSLTELLLEIVEQRRRDPDDLLLRAQRLGIDVTAPSQLILVDFPDRVKQAAGADVELQRAVDRLARKHSRRGLAIALEGGVACHIPFESGKGRDRTVKLMRRIADEVLRSSGEQPIVVLSNKCQALADYKLEWDRCWRMIRLSQAFDRRGALFEHDFGPLPMLMAAAKSDDVRAFVDGCIGAMVQHDRAHGTQYLETLAQYLNEGCRSQACADAMGLHVTTLRYRLARMQELFNVTFDGPEQRFALELAVRLHNVIEPRG